MNGENYQVKNITTREVKKSTDEGTKSEIVWKVTLKDYDENYKVTIESKENLDESFRVGEYKVLEINESGE